MRSQQSFRARTCGSFHRFHRWLPWLKEQYIRCVFLTFSFRLFRFRLQNFFHPDYSTLGQTRLCKVSCHELLNSFSFGHEQLTCTSIAVFFIGPAVLGRSTWFYLDVIRRFIALIYIASMHPAFFNWRSLGIEEEICHLCRDIDTLRYLLPEALNKDSLNRRLENLFQTFICDVSALFYNGFIFLCFTLSMFFLTFSMLFF